MKSSDDTRGPWERFGNSPNALHNMAFGPKSLKMGVLLGMLVDFGLGLWETPSHSTESADPAKVMGLIRGTSLYARQSVTPTPLRCHGIENGLRAPEKQPPK